MFEQVKEILDEKYKSEIARFDELKNEVDALEQQMKEDNTEEEYQNSIKELNKEYGIFKRGKEYKEKLNKLKADYFEKLKDFEKIHNNYIDLKNEASKINVYILQKKIEQLNNAEELKDLKITESEAQKIINDKLSTL
jgi:hypothetical protein